jgi:SAM-dependent methyltransferase
MLPRTFRLPPLRVPLISTNGSAITGVCFSPQPASNPNKALWEKGDFTRIASTMRESGEALVRQFGIQPGLKVLDVGCGDGTTAIPMAKLGADVLGVDIARNLVAAGNRRGTELGLANCRFQEGDATNLRELPDQAFDLVVSIFGAMFAPKPLDVARELVRVTRPGGRIIMGNWIPGDPTLDAQILKIWASYTPPPPQGFISPMTRGPRKGPHRAIHRSGNSEGQHRLRERHVPLQLSWVAVRVLGSLPPILRAYHERL